MGQHLVAPSVSNSAVLVNATVVAVSARVNLQQVYNLTVDQLHTYYVQTSVGTTVLVHNCGGGFPDLWRTAW